MNVTDSGVKISGDMVSGDSSASNTGFSDASNTARAAERLRREMADNERTLEHKAETIRLDQGLGDADEQVTTSQTSSLDYDQSPGKEIRFRVFRHRHRQSKEPSWVEKAYEAPRTTRR